MAAALRQWLPDVTQGRYTDARVDPSDLRVQVLGPDHEWRDARRFSHGTAEQIYLLLRVVLAERLATTGETLPAHSWTTSWCSVIASRKRALLDVMFGGQPHAAGDSAHAGRGSAGMGEQNVVPTKSPGDVARPLGCCAHIAKDRFNGVATVNDDLRRLVHDRLSSEGLLQKNWSSLVLAACDGRDAVEGLLLNAKAAAKPSAPAGTKKRAGAYLTSLTVEGFRGIGPKQTLTFTPGPGLTIVVGRNGSGKSSFAEALEVLLTGDSKRWSDRSKIWKEGWRNLHQAHPAAIEAELLLEGGKGTQRSRARGTRRPALEAQKVGRPAEREAQDHAAGAGVDSTRSSRIARSFPTTSWARCWTKDPRNSTTRCRWCWASRISSTRRRRSRRAVSIGRSRSTPPMQREKQLVEQLKTLIRRGAGRSGVGLPGCADDEELGTGCGREAL